jgi:hypothetical protein
MNMIRFWKFALNPLPVEQDTEENQFVFCWATR